LAIEETRDSNQELKDISLLNCRRVMDLKEKSNVGEVTGRLDAKGCGAVVKWLLPKLGAAWCLAGSTLHLPSCSDVKVERKEGRQL
jgi:hypothetical protein